MYGNETGEHRLVELTVANCKKMLKNARKWSFWKVWKKQQKSKNRCNAPTYRYILLLVGVSMGHTLVHVYSWSYSNGCLSKRSSAMRISWFDSSWRQKYAKNRSNQLFPHGTPKYRCFQEECPERKRLYSVKTKSKEISQGSFVCIGVVYAPGEFDSSARPNKYSLKF